MSFTRQEKYNATGGLFVCGIGGWGSKFIKFIYVERPIFRNFKIAKIQITKDELFGSFILEFNF